MAVDVLAGIAATEERERSGIFSTAAGTISAYRSSRALQLAERANFDPSSFPVGADTIYVCAPARYQVLMAPVVVAFLEQVRAATYRAAAEGTLRLPVTMVLDEVANVAPLPDLPAMVSEGGGQGLLTLACLQDLSQARNRWGPSADGFFSLFGTKVLLPGIGDIRTLDAVSRLAGQGDVVVRSVNTSAWWSTPSFSQYDVRASPPGPAPRGPGPQPARWRRDRHRWRSTPAGCLFDQLVGLPTVLRCQAGETARELATASGARTWLGQQQGAAAAITCPRPQATRHGRAGCPLAPSPGAATPAPATAAYLSPRSASSMIEHIFGDAPARSATRWSTRGDRGAEQLSQTIAMRMSGGYRLPR